MRFGDWGGCGCGCLIDLMGGIGKHQQLQISKLEARDLRTQWNREEKRRVEKSREEMMSMLVAVSGVI